MSIVLGSKDYVLKKSFFSLYLFKFLVEVNVTTHERYRDEIFSRSTKLYPNIFDFIKFASFSCIFRGRTLQF